MDFGEDKEYRVKVQVRLRLVNRHWFMRRDAAMRAMMLMSLQNHEGYGINGNLVDSHWSEGYRVRNCRCENISNKEQQLDNFRDCC